MKKLVLSVAAVGIFAALSLTGTPAEARDSFRFSFDTGAVSMAFSDGYYDHNHRWHKWRNQREAREFRGRYSHIWRDYDRDGIPNRYDRDRDNDGVPNRFDRRPNNPYDD